jgi:predicted RNase H-like nuclease
MAGERVLGVDACRGGWVGIALEGDRIDAYVATGISELVLAAAVDGELAVVAIDIPIGLPEQGYRQADVLARAEIGPLWPSVFMTPTRAALEAESYTAALEICRRDGEKGISVQAFGLRKRIKEVEDWSKAAQCRVVEVHPEVSFKQLAGKPLTAGKHTWAGIERRRQLLSEAEIQLPSDLGRAGTRAGVDDVLDAAAAAWSARRVVDGSARTLPARPHPHCAIWV